MVRIFVANMPTNESNRTDFLFQMFNKARRKE
jgi:hypothetical protein